MKYLVYWRSFIAENDIQKKKEDLENTKKTVAKLVKRMRIEFK